MRLDQRGFVLAAFGLGPLLLAAGCGAEATGARSTVVQVAETSYQLKDPVTTTTTTPVPVEAEEGFSANEQTYTVVSGDSVFRIAGLFDIEPDALANYNDWPEGIQHPLQIGDAVRVPPNSKIPGASTGSTGSSGDSGDTGDSGDSGDTGSTEATSAPGTGCQHTIVEGDNPTRVAKKYDITVDELQAANATNPVYQTFLLGSQLTIPAGGSC